MLGRIPQTPLTRLPWKELGRWLGTLGLLGGISAKAALVEVSEISEPAGFVSQSTIVNTGEEFTTLQPTLSTNGYVFGYWKAGTLRLTDDGGRSVTQGTVQIDAELTLTAYYFPENEDSDSDGIRDWFEWRNFGGLGETLLGDPDYDNFTNGQEDALGQEPTIPDLVLDGGISARQSTGFVFADTSMVQYVIRSEPIGFVTTTEAYVEQNSTVSTPNLHGETNGYQFAYWSVNGTRQAGPTGVARSQVILELNASSTFVAHYLPTSDDNDSDGIADWFEYYQFGHLDQGPGDDPDYDSFSNARENALGQEATIRDLVEDGGISARQSTGFVFADTSMVKYVVKSEPIGFVTTTEAFVEQNSTVSTPNLHGETNGYQFAYWTMNGVRQASPIGVAVSQVIAEISESTTFVAHYLPTSDDNDSDGIADWFEYYQFGNLDQGPGDDPDYDSFSNARENALGQEATIRDLVEDGGISARQSNGLLYYLQNDPVPSISAPHSFALDLAKPFDHTIVVTGQMDQMSMSGNLPPGITFDSYSSRLSGVPVQLGSYAITITVHGGTHVVSQVFTFEVLHAPTLTTELLAPDAAMGDYFGASVDLRGSWAVIGANLADVSGQADAGAAYLYQVEANGSSAYKQKLVADSPEADAEFGLSVAVSPPFLVVGAPKTDANGLEDSGSAYLYRIEDNGSATFLSTLQPESSDQAAGALFGHSVAIDGSRILIGAPGGSSMQGNAFLFEVDTYGTPGPASSVSPDDGSADDAFGRSVALSGDQFAVGAPGSNSMQGSLYFFSIDGSGIVSQTGKSDRGSNASASDGLGHSLALHQSLALGGAPSADSGGAVLQVEIDEYGIPLSTTTESNSSKLSGDEFGHSVAIGRVTGEPIIGIGRPKSDPGGQPNAGTFNLAKATNYPLTAPQPKPNDEFGISGTIDAKRVIVGAWKRDPNFIANAGAAYLFYNPEWGESVGNLFELTLLASGPGQVTGAGIQIEGADAPIEAIPDAGAEFLGWSGSGAVAPLASRTTVPMTEDRNLTATFGMITKDLVVGIQGQGDANGSDTYLLNSTVTIRATPAEGHHFTGWQGSGVANPSLPETTVFMSADRNLTATFAINQYELSFATSTQGTLTGAGTYNHGTLVPISARPNSGMLFTGWTGEGVANPLDRNSSVLMTQARNLSASFVNGSTFAGLFLTSGGEVDEDLPAGLQAASFLVKAGSEVLDGFSFSLVPDPQGSSLNNALFSFDANSSGSLLTASELDFESLGSSLAVFVEADNGNGVTLGKRFPIVLRDSNVEAFRLTVSSGAGGSANGAGEFPPGTLASIEAVANPGFLFSNWQGLGVADAFAEQTTISMTSDRTVIARFNDLNSSNAEILMAGGGEVNEDEPSGLEAGTFLVRAGGETQTGFSFSLVPDKLGSDLDNAFFAFDENATGKLLTASELDFETLGSSLKIFVQASGPNDAVLAQPFAIVLRDSNLEPFDLNLTAEAGGQVEGGGLFTPGTLAPIKAVPEEGFVFSSWEGLGVSDPSAAETIVIMNENRSVKARFQDLHREADFQLDRNRILENQPVGTELGSFSVSARQQTLNGYQFFLSLDDRNDSLNNSLFAIDPSTGTLHTKEALDFEEHESRLSVFVEAAKGSDKVLRKKFDLVLENVDEPPTLVLDTHAFELTENNGTLVTTVSGSDPEQANLVYGLSTTSDHSLFKMNAATGVLEFKNPPDFDDPADKDKNNAYQLEVTLTDSTHLAKQGITVRVLDDPFDKLEITHNQGDDIEVKEGLPAGTLVTTFSFGNHQDARFSLIASEGSDLHHFFLSPEGDLFTTEPIDPDLEQLTIVVEASLGSTVRHDKFLVFVTQNTSQIAEGEDFEESALMVRDVRVVNDPMRTGLNPIERIENIPDRGIYVFTREPHGRKVGDSVVLADVKGIEISELRNWNFMVDDVNETSFRLNNFEKTKGQYTGAIGSPVTGSGDFGEIEEAFLLGPWTFGHLIGNMVGEQDDPMDFLQHFLSQWRFEQTINGWPTDIKDGTFNGTGTSFAKLPFRLLAIGNRLDLFKAKSVHEIEDAGEGRFVFCLTGTFSEIEKNGYSVNKSHDLQCSFIFEYGQKAKNFKDLAEWTKGWQHLAQLWPNHQADDPSPEYLAHLTEMGDRFSKRGADPDKPNGNSINQVRTNDFVLTQNNRKVWQFREFTLRDREDPEIKDFSITAKPELTTKGSFGGAVGLWTTTNKGNPMVKGPSISTDFTKSPILSQWINQRESQILDGEVGPPAPKWMEGGIANHRFGFSFKPPGVRINLARHKFSLSTCGGCHNGDTRTSFFMIVPRPHNQESSMPSFLTGGTVRDTVNSNEFHHYDDLRQRENNMGNLVTACKLVMPERMRLSVVDLPSNSDQLAKPPTLTVQGGVAVQWKFELAEGLGDAHNQDFSIGSDQTTLKLKDGSSPGAKTIRVRATALDENGAPDGTGVTLERPYSIFVREGSESPEIEAEDFPAFSKVAPHLFTPNPNRVH